MWLIIESMIVLALAIVVFSRISNPTPYIDEYYHVLAAQSLVNDGTLYLYDGGEPYTRAKAYTYAVAGCYRLFGESWDAGRLPSLACGALLVMSVFAWLYHTTGRRIAWLAALMLILSPHFLGFSSMIRFYMPHMLFVWLAWISAYGFLVGGYKWLGRCLIFLAGVVTALIAAHLQTTTAIAALAVGVWAATVFIGYLINKGPQQARKTIFVVMLVLIVVIPLFVVGLKMTGAWDHMALKMNTSRPWTEATRHQFQYYHRFFKNNYPMLWACFPFIAIAALAHRRRQAWFCLMLFSVPFVAHSLLPFKGERYLSYAWTCFFVVLAIGLDGLLDWLHSRAQDLIGQLYSQTLAEKKWVSAAIVCFLLGSLAFAWMVTPSYAIGRQMLTGASLGPLQHEDWATATPILKPIADQTGFIIDSCPPKAIYHFGRMDMGLSVSQAQDRPEFAIHPKLNRPVIYSAEAMKQVMDEHAKGLIIIETAHFGAWYFVPPDTAAFIQTHTTPIDLPADLGIKAFKWGTDVEPLSTPLPDQME